MLRFIGTIKKNFINQDFTEKNETTDHIFEQNFLCLESYFNSNKNTFLFDSSTCPKFNFIDNKSSDKRKEYDSFLLKLKSKVKSHYYSIMDSKEIKFLSCGKKSFNFSCGLVSFICKNILEMGNNMKIYSKIFNIPYTSLNRITKEIELCIVECIEKFVNTELQQNKEISNEEIMKDKKLLESLKILKTSRKYSNSKLFSYFIKKLESFEDLVTRHRLENEKEN